jgi:hypothetical protein
MLPVAVSELSNWKDAVTVQPLSISPLPEKVTSSPIEKPLPFDLFSWLAKPIPAEPVTSNAPAKAEVAIRELPKAVKPIFF